MTDYVLANRVPFVGHLTEIMNISNVYCPISVTFYYLFSARILK